MQFTQNLTSRNGIFVMVFILLCIALFNLPTGFESMAPDTHRAKALVIEVDNSDIRQNLIVRQGSQDLNVKILDGPYKGHTAMVVNRLIGKMELDEMYREGHKVLVEFSVSDGEIKSAFTRGRYRLDTTFILLGLFATFLVIVAGSTGFKALLSFIFAVLVLWKIMFPLFLKGYPPIPIALGVVAALTASVSFLVGGLSKKGLVTFLGAFLGLLLTAALAFIFTRQFHIHGAVRPFAETLLYSGFYDLNLSHIFIAGIFIASSGAVMDLAMDISASMHEVIEKYPAISIKDHMASGMAVGRAVIGTMTTTLLLAYSGSYTCMMMLFMSQGVPVENIINLNYVSAEMVNTIVGSFGLVTVAPFTALVGGFVYRRGVNRSTSEDHEQGARTRLESASLPKSGP